MFEYELWNGEKVLGYYESKEPLKGKFVAITSSSQYCEFENITVPITTRLVSDTEVEATYRVVLDVRKKSRRQISLIMTRNVKK